MPTAFLLSQHRQIESALDALAASIAAGAADWEAFHRAHRLCVQHYADEAEFLVRLTADHPGLARKLAAQHEEALEIASHLAEPGTEGGASRDSVYLLRRFMAIVQHNIIEEERDVFPLSGSFRKPPAR